MNLYYTYKSEKGIKLYRVQFQLIKPHPITFCCKTLLKEWCKFQVNGARNPRNESVSISTNVIFREESVFEIEGFEIVRVLEKISFCPFCGEEFKMIEQRNNELYV